MPFEYLLRKIVTHHWSVRLLDGKSELQATGCSRKRRPGREKCLLVAYMKLDSERHGLKDQHLAVGRKREYEMCKRNAMRQMKKMEWTVTRWVKQVTSKLRVSNMKIRKQNVIVVISPHPDDAEVACGGTIRRFAKKGYEIVVIILSRGERGGDPELRKEESVAALEKLGVKASNIVFGNFEDTAIPDGITTIRFLEQYSGENVYAVLIPSFNDTHQDHRAAAHCSLSAFRNVPRILAYESPSVIAQFSRTIFIDITDDIKEKIDAVQCHGSQISKNKEYLKKETVLSRAYTRGAEVGVDYAEAFQVIRFIFDPADVLPRLEAESPDSRTRSQCNLVTNA